MSILSRLLKKRKQPDSSDNFKIILKTEKELSEKQKNAILTIVQNGIQSGEDFHTIGVLLVMHVDITRSVILNEIKNGVEVII